MLVNAVALLEALFYLCAVPVNLALRLRGLRLGAGLSAFEWRAARKRAALDIAKPPKRNRGPAPRRALRVLSRLRIDRARLTGRVALGDAAATALACGALTGLARALSGRAGRVEVDVRPDFGGDVAVELDGMIRARTGQIILAAIRVLTEEAFPWTTTRLKT